MVRTVAAFVALALLCAPAAATPARIILVRHAEKLDDYALCDMGTMRAQALAKQYLGEGASQSLFAAGERPAALLVMTVHTFDTISPTAQSWKMPATIYSVVPAKGGKNEQENLDENERTREAARDVLQNPAYDGKTVVVMWEHERLANAKLEARYKGEEEVSWRQLLHLDTVAGVPDTWPDETYDYFWLVDYRGGRQMPAGFKLVRETFTAPYDKLPSNAWGTPEPQHIAAGCLK